MTKDQLKATLRGLLREVLEARFTGGSYAKLARAHGYADGYMRAMLDAGLADSAEMLRLVGSVRESFLDQGGAPARAMRLDDAADHAAAAI